MKKLSLTSTILIALGGLALMGYIPASSGLAGAGAPMASGDAKTTAQMSPAGNPSMDQGAKAGQTGKLTPKNPSRTQAPNPMKLGIIIHSTDPETVFNALRLVS